MNLSTLGQKITKPVAMKNREPMFYIERSKIGVKDNNVVAFAKNALTEQLEQTVIPVASVGCLLVGPGCSITNEAVKIISRRDCCLMFSGGGGVPIYSYSGNYKSSKNKLKQIELISDPKKRLDSVKFLLNKRNEFLAREDIKIHPDDVAACKNVQECFLVEARWAKKFYAEVNSKTENKKNDLQKLTNSFCYGLVVPIIINMGFDPNIGLMHGTNRGGGLIFDIADLIKSACSVKVSAQATAMGLSPNESKYLTIKTYKDKGYQTKLINIVRELYGLDD